MPRKTKIEAYEGPAGGWGSLKSVGEILIRERISPLASLELWRQNKPDGFMCVSCAWAKPISASNRFVWLCSTSR